MNKYGVLSPKFHPVSTQMSIQSIFELLQQTIRQHQRNSIAISFAKMDELEPSFMYTQIFAIINEHERIHLGLSCQISH